MGFAFYKEKCKEATTVIQTKIRQQMLDELYFADIHTPQRLKVMPLHFLWCPKLNKCLPIPVPLNNVFFQGATLT